MCIDVARAMLQADHWVTQVDRQRLGRWHIGQTLRPDGSRFAFTLPKQGLDHRRRRHTTENRDSSGLSGNLASSMFPRW
jgi:hypothetical protein